MSTAERASTSVTWEATPLTGEHLDCFHADGFVVIEGAYPEEVRAELAAAVRRDLPAFDAAGFDSPTNGLHGSDFPYTQMIFNRFTVDPQLLAFVRRVLQTEDIHFRRGHNWARYPIADTAPPEQVHMDHGNNSLLPPVDDVRYGQVSCWYFPESVAPDQAPMMVIPKQHGRDVSSGVSLTVAAGTLMIFNTTIWHSATRFAGGTGQRYSITRIYGRADHYWEGNGLITRLGRVAQFREFIGSLTAREREVFRFPPVAHPFYTTETLEILEAQYPGWNARGEYAPGVSIRPNDAEFLHMFPLEADR